jgi:hypothetical protein
MKWYLAKFVYQVINGNGNHAPKFDEQMRLIRADEFNWAKEKASILGRLGECSFLNEQREAVQWKFINVVDLCSITSMQDGDELYSSTEEPENVSNYLAKITAKASRLAQA